MVTNTAEAVAPGTHNCVIAPHLKNEIAGAVGSRYSRMFPDLPSPIAPEEALLALGRSGAVIDDRKEDDAGDNSCIPAGWPFFGQFIAHDITADRSAISHHASVDRLTNFRTPRLDLEAVYASGPIGSPYLYDLRDADKFLLGVNDAGRPDDVPRNSQGRALTGDPRNDVHQLISQLHLAILKFHNGVVDWLRERGTPAADVFGEAQRLVRWHYQWIVVHEFLPLTIGQELVDDILAYGPRYYRAGARPYIPVEFSDAAYRYGHSQIRARYHLNATASGSVFPECAGACPVAAGRVLDWRYYFDVDSQQAPQPTRRIDARLVHSLIALPPAVVGETEIPEHHSLAVRDLLRGRALDLPSGEAIAREMGVVSLTAEELRLVQVYAPWRGETPLWYYILKESEVRQDGQRLGTIGGRIVGEVLLGLISADPAAYLAEQGWVPTLPAVQKNTFTMADLLRFASVTTRSS
ncbi:MAG: Myeloperoxidase, thyroid peroxidase, cyclooxygenase catalytic domain [Chloroflexi bacterium]|nr:Myeloperoxidase, thyroid peroxidase, cyclooxygenase catalytic domain [Chloroflexota bacterium]